MENQYYTPNIEDLGFDSEFEVYNSFDKYFFEAPEGWYKTKPDYGILLKVR